MSDVIEIAQSYDGVQYATQNGNKIRVVFKHNADASVIEQVSDLFPTSKGELGATQEHLACVDYVQD